MLSDFFIWTSLGNGRVRGDSMVVLHRHSEIVLVRHLLCLPFGDPHHYYSRLPSADEGYLERLKRGAHAVTTNVKCDKAQRCTADAYPPLSQGTRFGGHLGSCWVVHALTLHRQRPCLILLLTGLLQQLACYASSRQDFDPLGWVGIRDEPGKLKS